MIEAPAIGSRQVRAGQRFARAFRLRRRADFLRVQGQGNRLHVRHFLVFIVRNPTSANLSAPRLGVTVTRKVGVAVVRNRIKRWVREAFRRCRTLVPPGIDMVWVAKRNAAETDYATIAKDMQRVCTQLQAPRGAHA